MKTVLVVDDLESVRYYHELILQRSGYHTRSARDGAEALAIVGREPVDLVMLDLVMPGMPGPEFMTRLRQVKTHAHPPVLVITSEALLETARQLARETGCELLQKPLLPDGLLGAVERILGPA